MDENEEFEFRLRMEREGSAQPTKPSKPIAIGRDAFADTLRHELQGTDWLTRNIAGAGSAVVNAWEGLKGLAGQTDPNQVAEQKIIAEEAPVGNIAGNVGMFALAPGVQSVRGAAAVGAGAGALLTPGTLQERAIAGGLGGLGGAAGAKIAQKIAGSKPFETSAAVRKLTDEGITPTPGQNLGGTAQVFEDKMVSMPFLGDVIRNARDRGVAEFNQAAMRRAALPGQSADDIGYGGVQQLRESLNQAYESTLAKASVDALDPKFVSQLSTLRSGVQSLPQREAQMFDDIIDRQISQRLAPNGKLNAENLQSASSGLKKEASDFAQSSDAYQRKLGDALKQASAELHELVKRANPKVRSDLDQIDKAYANFKRIQRASSNPGASEGVFTPNQLNSAIRQMDRSKDKRAFSEGNALMQDLSSAGRQVLASKTGDSGTAGRSMVTNPVAWLAAAPAITAAIPASIMYSKTGSKVINAMVNKGLRPTAESVRKVMGDPRMMASLGISGTLSDLQQ